MQTWAWAAAGGALIGLSAGLMMLLLGRIAGISGILGSLLPPRAAADRLWRIGFLAGLVLGPLLLALAGGTGRIGQPALGLPGMAVAGLLVGTGTALGAGCTSGHGVCGLSRLSPRSLVNVLVFMGTGFATVYVLRHVLA